MTNPKDCFGCKYYKKDSKDWCQHSWKDYCINAELWTPCASYCFKKEYFEKVGVSNA